MIVTHTQAANGQRRIYLGGKASLECYIAPRADGQGWTFHLDDAVSGNELSDVDRRGWAVHTLMQLADMLAVAAADLAAVPFEMIAALHSTNPYDGRRVAVPKRQSIENGFMATPPHITRPSGDFKGGEYPRQRRTA